MLKSVNLVYSHVELSVKQFSKRRQHNSTAALRSTCGNALHDVSYPHLLCGSSGCLCVLSDSYNVRLVHVFWVFVIWSDLRGVLRPPLGVGRGS